MCSNYNYVIRSMHADRGLEKLGKAKYSQYVLGGKIENFPSQNSFKNRSDVVSARQKSWERKKDQVRNSPTSSMPLSPRQENSDCRHC